MKNLFFMLFVSLACFAFADKQIEITSVEAHQRCPWDGLVDIVVTIQGGIADMDEIDFVFAATNGATKVMIPVEHITRKEDNLIFGDLWMRRFVWDMTADVGTEKIDDVALTIVGGARLSGVQLWEDGPYWAECNVGATKPEEYGYYFWWGDTVGYKRDGESWNAVDGSQDNFMFASGNCPTYGKSNSQLRSAGYIDASGNLVAEYDAATVHLGAPWRMPTDAEFSELLNNCTTQWTTHNGIPGRIVKGKGTYASKSIFIPASGNGYDSRLYSYGYYWSSTVDLYTDCYRAGNLYVYSDYLRQDPISRYWGYTIRPLRGCADGNVSVSAVTTTHFTWAPLGVNGVEVLQSCSGSGSVDIVVAIQGAEQDIELAKCFFVATNSITKRAIPIEHISQKGEDSKIGDVWTRRFVWDAAADVAAVKFDDVELTVGVTLLPIPAVQLWEDGPYWAECNVGATKPEEHGYYFWWGDTVGYKRDGESWNAVDGSQDNFLFTSGNCPTYGKSNSRLQSAGYIDSSGNLVTEYDAATVHLGAPWRMPTDAEFSALINNCTTTWTIRNGVNGRLVTGKGSYALNSIFIPAAGYGNEDDIGLYDSSGYCWSSTPRSELSDHAWNLGFNSGRFFRFDSGRYLGRSVRPVCGFVKKITGIRRMTTRFSLDCRRVYPVHEVKVAGVSVRQRYPWNGLVDVAVTIQGAAEDVEKAECSFIATNVIGMAEIPVRHLTLIGEESDSDGVWTRRFVWNASADIGSVKMDDVELTVEAKIPLEGVQLWEGGPYWAESNVGALNPEDSGYYFWWGDRVGYARVDSSWYAVDGSHSWFAFIDQNCPTCGKYNSQLQSMGYVDASGNLVSAHDAATTYLGKPWRMPTDSEFGELISNCTITESTKNGVPGLLVVGKGEYSSKNIFIPSAGCGRLGDLLNVGPYGSAVWSSTLSRLNNSLGAWCCCFGSDGIKQSSEPRDYGMPVRPIRGGSDVLRASKTTLLSLDCREGMRMTSAEGELLRYDVSWYADANIIRITDNGLIVETGTEGCYAWRPDPNGLVRHVFKLEALNGGSVVATETAEFSFCNIRNVTARQLWPHKKVEVCYEVAEDSGEVTGENAPLMISYGENVAQTVLGDTRCTPGLHRVVWDVENEDLQPRYEWYRCTFKNVLGVSGSSHDKMQLSEISLYDASGARKNKGDYVFRDVNTAPENLNPGDVTLISSVGTLGADSESPSNLFDGDAGTKWCMVNRRGYVAESAGNWQTVVFRLLNGAAEVSHYTLSTANDDTPRCNPNNWIVEGSNDGRSWYRLDAQEGDLLPTTTYTESQAFAVASGVAQRVCVWYGTGDDAEAKGVSAPVVIDTSSAVGDGMAVDSPITLGYTPMDVGEVEVQVDGTTLLLSDSPGEFLWTPLSLGSHTLKHIVGDEVWTRTVNVTSLPFATPSAPNPPTAPDANITIKQASHSFAVEGGAYSIPTAGVDGYTGGFGVSKSASWITINSAEVNWKAGRSIVYTVTANDGADERTGYVYVGGHVHTITQAGVGAELSSYSADVEYEGGAGSFTVLTEEGISWNARPNANWITISPTTGTGEKDVTFTVSPWNDVSIRSATITAAGRTFTVNQIGRHMKLDKSAVSTDYNAQTVELLVSALPFVEWDVESSAPWISIADVGGGKAAGTVTLAVAENSSYLSRTASVRVGTETVTITQARCPAAALNFTIDPTQATALAAGGTGIVTVAAAPGLPWSVQSKADWIVLLPSTVSGSGDGVFTYVVEPNPTMAERVEMITVSPETASELASKTIVVVQSAAKAEISEKEHEFAAKGESFEVGVSVLDVVQWNVTAVPNWVTIEGETARTGPGVVRVTVKENPSTAVREAMIIIAGQEFRIIQSGRTVKAEPSVVGVSMSGGDGTINVIAEANVIWGASKSDMWISIWGDDDCDYDADGNVVDAGSGIVNYYIDGCDEGGLPRTGWIMVGDKRVSILQTREGVLVSVVDDPGAVVAGDMESGFVIKPSEGNTAVEVTIPHGVDAAKVTVEVSPKVTSVKPNGAKVKIVVGENDITDYLVMPESGGVLNIADAMVKEEIVKEALDPCKDAVIELNAANPQLITSPTRKGLTYTLYEGHRLESLSKGDSKLGDGDPWKPTIRVSGGDAAFYSIDVRK